MCLELFFGWFFSRLLVVSLGLVFVWFYWLLWVFSVRGSFAFLCSLESLFWWFFLYYIHLTHKKMKTWNDFCGVIILSFRVRLTYVGG